MDTFHTQSAEWARVNVEPEHAAAAIVRRVTRFDDMAEDFFDSVASGVDAAIDEIDVATFGVIDAQVRTAVSMEVEAQAKRLALEMIRDLAASQGKEKTLPF